ncbi:3'(2'),5'-bisphosphate nucleotidase CysQ [Actinospica durhamensis]|uniref:3'(2'),5'-bisphosphate nucleotidase CysQ n=1 Tax=Actinospica durhamensis TaxID=1508375 RepID=A0A941EJT2_9ACTN|nr:inositol monophosphatase family protein [Actinospica durhamensis]MBR7831817.1 3'(2'),5'-bisphosphate nucleotidase CysQ [Actinospica durhamensis]
MTNAALLPPMTQAARTLGTWLAEQERPRPARTMAEFKDVFDAVDTPAAALLHEHLDRLRPGVPWAEGLYSRPLPAGEIWVVDVMDGAVQYLQGLSQWCVSLTLVKDHEPVAAVLHSPVLGETYTAALGHGAHRDGTPISPSDKQDLAVTLLATSQPPFIATQPEAATAAGRSLSALLPMAGAIRNLGPTSWQIADTAAGRIDAFWQYGRDNENLLGAALIAREAGAQVTDTAGAPWKAGSDSFLTAPPALHRQLLPLLAGHR